MFDLEGELELELGQARPPQRYAFRDESIPRAKPKAKGSKSQSCARTRRARSSTQLGSLDSEEAALLEAALGVAPAELPPHLRCYALQRRKAASFSGPGVLPGEQEAGRVEYKLRLLDPTPDRFQQLVTQLNWRLSEGCGECLYCLGVEDNGHPLGLSEVEMQASLRVLEAMAAEVGATAEVLQTPPGSSEGLRCAVVRVAHSRAPAPSYTDLRVAVAGGVDSGKSTLVGVLSHGAGGVPLLDNGRGSSRMQVFRHKHEIESGHTSSISLQQLAYDAKGNVLNYSALASLGPAELAGAAARVLRFFDLGGHERFSKTALHGLTCMLPDYAMLCVNAATGVSWVTREHLAVAIALGIPVFIAITKTDQAREAAVQQAAAEIRELLAAAVEQGGGVVEDAASLAPLVQSEAEAVRLAAGMQYSRIATPGAPLCVPLFPTSAVTGASLQLLHSFLNALQPAGSSSGSGAAGSEGCGMQGWQQQQSAGAAAFADQADSGNARQQQQRHHPSHFQIDGSFEVSGVGTVYSGTVVSGCVCVADELLLGPLEGGTFQRVVVSSIHRSKVAVQSAQQGQHATVAVQPADSCPGLATAGSSDEGGALGGTAGWAGSAGMSMLADHPACTDSAGCLHAWMRQTASLAGMPAAGLPAGVSGAAHHAANGLPISHSAVELGAPHSQQLQQQQPQLHGGPASPADLLHRWASSPQLAPAGSGPVPRPRKGAVLLDPSLEPQACFEFEAVLVLLGGHWPARGLLSGRYPPEGEADEPDPLLLSPPTGGSLGTPLGTSAASDCGDGGLAGSSLGTRPHSLGKRSSSRRRGGQLSYIPVVHCGSIRQAAQVVALRELPLTRSSGGSSSNGSSGSGSSFGGGGRAAASGDLGWSELGLGLDLSGLEELLPDDRGDAQEQGQGQAGVEEPLSALLMGWDLETEPSESEGGSSALLGTACGMVAGALRGVTPRPHVPDKHRLAGAVAAAGVLLPLPLSRSSPGATSSSLACSAGTSTAPSGSSGHVSGGEGSATPAGAGGTGAESAPPTAAGSPALQLAAAGLKCQRSSLIGSQDIGCIVAVTFRFMHHPEWLVEGARLIVRDRTTGRTSGAGYVTAAGAIQAPPAR